VPLPDLRLPPTLSDHPPCEGGKNFLYHVMFANGSSYKAETNRGKKVLGSLGYRSGGWIVEAVAQYERAKTGDDDLILKGFGAYSGPWGRLGVTLARRSYKEEGADASSVYKILSVFAVFRASERIDLIGRYDLNFGEGYKKSFPGHKISYVPFADNAEFSFLIAALSCRVHKNVRLIPNVKLALYEEPDQGEKPGGDFYANLTLWFRF